jgi:hypothetical protein
MRLDTKWKKIIFQDVNVNVIFFNSSERENVTANYNELLEAFKKFADKVRKFMWERVPQLNEHPYWGPWLRGERD